MRNTHQSILTYVKSGEYFIDARLWYARKYLFPVYERSMLAILATIIIICMTTILLTIYSFFPLDKQLKYTVHTAGSNKVKSRILKADVMPNNPARSIAIQFVKNYIKRRESYEYDNIEQQMHFVRNSSTSVVFRGFYNYINIDNPRSPILRYQRQAARKINLQNARFDQDNNLLVTFRSIAKENEDVFEDMLWEATISYDMDPIIVLPDQYQELDFNFKVTDYKVRLLKDNLNG